MTNHTETMSKSVDSIFAGMTEAHRGLVALGMVAALALSVGIALGSMGVREDVAALKQADERLVNDISANRSRAEGLSSELSTVQSIIQQTGLVDMSERVRRIDRELCLLRANTQPELQACARR